MGTRVERPQALPLVGRDAELEALRETFAELPAPPGVVLEGEAGIGKTALWLAGVAEAESRGLRVVTVRPVEAETGLSHAALGDLLGPLDEELADDIPAPQRHALDVALLRASPDAGAVDSRAVGAATIAVLRAAAQGGPVVLAIDDVQWLDPPSARALAFALRRLRDDPVTLLATRRLTAQAGSLELALAEEQLVRIEVRPLGVEAIQRMLQSRLEARLPLPVVARLAELSAGNPYYALELARAALREAGGGPLTADLPLPEGIHAVLQERLRALPEATRDAVGTVAAMGVPTIAVATAVVDPAALEPAFTADVVHEEGDSWRPPPSPRSRTGRWRRRRGHLCTLGCPGDRESRPRHAVPQRVSYGPPARTGRRAQRRRALPPHPLGPPAATRPASDGRSRSPAQPPASRS